MEYSIGTKLTLEVVEAEGHSCEGCFFCDESEECSLLAYGDCRDFERTDHKNIIYKEIKEEKIMEHKIGQIITLSDRRKVEVNVICKEIKEE